MVVLLETVTVDDGRGVMDRPRRSTRHAPHAACEVVADDELEDRRGHGEVVWLWAWGPRGEGRTAGDTVSVLSK
ncbi:MAG: hypothetical protein U1F53_01155 [Burkholderiaceae bacterium]